jgi:alpha-amylase
MRKKMVQLLLVPFLLFYALHVEATEKEVTWEDEIIYFIMVDRFNNGDTSNDYKVNLNDPYAYHGGDIKGIIEKLDYIKDLGATTIWLTPIVANEKKGYHGYWTEDFYAVEEHFGTLEDFKTLVKKAHEKDMKVILDLVVNHTGYKHPWLIDLDMEDWFHEREDIFNWDSQKEVENGWLFGLPDLNHENEEVKNYLLDMAKWWIEETDIDGYRLDTVKHVPKWFWEEFSAAVKSVKEDFFLLGEVWHDDPTYVAAYSETGIQSFVDYPYYNEISKIFAEPNKSLEGLYSVWKRNDYYYEDPYILGNFVDNHDNVRFVRKAIQNGQDPETRLKLAMTYLYTSPGIPVIYQGTEIAMDGGEDPDNRRMMDFSVQTPIRDHIAILADIRKNHPSLTRGDFELVFEEKGMAIFKRTYEEETSVIAINNTTSVQTVAITEEHLQVDQQLNGLLTDTVVRYKNNKYEVELAAETAEIYVLGEKTTDITKHLYLIIPLLAIISFIFYIMKRNRKN